MLQILFLKIEQSNHAKVVEILTQNKSMLDVQHPKTGQTCLTVATRKNDGEMVEKLISMGAKLNTSNKFNQSALWISSFYNYRRTCEFLISNGADVDQQDKKGMSPLMIAAQRGNIDCIEVLLNSNADINLTNKNSETVFDLCKDSEVLQFIIQKLQIEEVNVKYPEKFKQKNNNTSSQKSTMSKFSSTSYKHEKSIPIFEMDDSMQTPLSGLIDQICYQMQTLFTESLHKFKEYILVQQCTIADAKQRTSDYLNLVQPCNTDDNIAFQYDSFQFEIQRQLGRTLYSILHHVGNQIQQPIETKQPFKQRFNPSDIVPLIEASVEEEQSTPLSEFRTLLKQVEAPAQIKDPWIRKDNKITEQYFTKSMTDKLESLNDMINSRIQGLKQ